MTAIISGPLYDHVCHASPKGNGHRWGYNWDGVSIVCVKCGFKGLDRG